MQPAGFEPQRRQRGINAVRRASPRRAHADCDAIELDVPQLGETHRHVRADGANGGGEIESLISRGMATPTRGDGSSISTRAARSAAITSRADAGASSNAGFWLRWTTRSRTPTNSRMARVPASPNRGFARRTIRV